MKNIDIDAFKNEGFTFEEIESVKRGLDDIENGKTISYKKVKEKARKEIFSKQRAYA